MTLDVDGRRCPHDLPDIIYRGWSRSFPPNVLCPAGAEKAAPKLRKTRTAAHTERVSEAAPGKPFRSSFLPLNRSPTRSRRSVARYGAESADRLRRVGSHIRTHG